MSLPSHSRSLRGFSMVEALVALVVLAAGMLGIASLYVVTLQTSGSAIYRMQAVNLASDIADRIRANRQAGAAYAASPPTSPPSSCQAAVCTEQQMADYDFYWWHQQVQEALPGNPTGTIEVTAGPGDANSYTITITWLEPGQSGDENRQSYVLRMQI
ncbi:MAG TPA: type IV pilus modification protein PilV [Steroidobacteraceae bacterium]